MCVVVMCLIFHLCNRLIDGQMASLILYLGICQEDGLLYLEVDPSGSDSWKLDPVIQLLKEGAVGVIPTDTVYVIFLPCCWLCSDS